MLLGLNQRLDTVGSSWQWGETVRKLFMTSKVLPHLRADEPTLGLAVSDWVREVSQHTVARLRELEVPLVGDWSDLTPHDVPGVAPSEVAPELLADAALTALAAVIDRDAQLARAPGVPVQVRVPSLRSLDSAGVGQGSG